ncbi:MAG TPA: right-handed parallel beta-helix repeat-containing protein [Planctomycetota bacterium]|nr:right-handed parallel beta-helix repeat-containing protein [Planctomycetota bacterium]
MDYHLAPDGDDLRDGRAPASAWRTLARASAAPLAAGDRVLLAGGATFVGPLVIDQRHGEDPERPIEIASSGDGRATIDGGTGDGVVVRDRGAVWIHDLSVRGDGVDANRGAGVSLTCVLEQRVARVLIERVEACGFRSGGIVVGASGGGGFDGVRIRDCVAHGNGEAGICAWGRVAKGAEQRWAHRDLIIERCLARDNRGIPEKTDNHSGNGIVIGCVEGALIDLCEAHGNGGDCNFTGGGPVGIWCWECSGVVIQRCESHHNRTGAGSLDGGGFDLDGGAVDSRISHCYAHDNDGAGYLICQYAGARAFRGNRVEHNVSHDDGRAHRYGAITVYAGGPDQIRDTVATGNLLIIAPRADAFLPPAIALMGTPQAVRFADNLTIAHGGCPNVRSDGVASAPLVFAGNLHLRSGGDAVRTGEGGETGVATIAAWPPTVADAQGEAPAPVAATTSGIATLATNDWHASYAALAAAHGRTLAAVPAATPRDAGWAGAWAGAWTDAAATRR